MVMEVEPWIRRMFLESAMAGCRPEILSRYVDKGGGNGWEVLRGLCCTKKSALFIPKAKFSSRIVATTPEACESFLFDLPGWRQDAIHSARQRGDLSTSVLGGLHVAGVVLVQC